MQASEIRPCDLCDKPLCEGGHVSFHRIRFERYGVDRNAVMDRAGLHNLFHGNASPALIEVFAPSTDVANLIHEPADLIVCEDCACGVSVREAQPLMVLAEIAHEKLEERKADAEARLVPANDDTQDLGDEEPTPVPEDAAT